MQRKLLQMQSVPAPAKQAASQERNDGMDAVLVIDDAGNATSQKDAFASMAGLVLNDTGDLIGFER